MILNKNFQRLLLCLILTLFIINVNAQCPLTIPFSINNQAQTQTCGTTVETSSLVTTHSTCIYAGEYSSLVNTQIGTTYCFKTKTDDYLTIYEENQAAVLGSGQGEVCVVAVSDTLFVQINLNPACDTQIGTCVVLESICQDCPPLTSTGCTDPVALNYIPCAVTDDGSCAYPDSGDTCADAVPLVVNALGAGCAVSNVIDFSAHSQSGATNCNPFNSNEYYDKWFTYTPATAAIAISNIMGFEDVDIYRNNCGNLENIICDADDNEILTGWLPGDQLYFRVYSFDNDDIFEFCVEELCSPYFEITDGACTSSLEFEVELTINDLGGTNSYSVFFIVDDPNGYSAYDPAVTITSTGVYTISNIPTNALEIQLQGTNNTACSISKNISYNCDCFDTTASNDLCIDAEQLTVQPYGCYSSTIGTLDCATWAGDDFSCDYFYYGYNNYNPYQYYGNTFGPKDVWYSFVVPASGSVGLTVNPINYYYYSGYSVTLLNGTCGNFVEENCFFTYGGVYDATVASSNSTTEFYNLTPGDIMFVRVAQASIGADVGVEYQLTADNNDSQLREQSNQFNQFNQFKQQTASITNNSNNNQNQILDFSICVFEDYKGSDCLTDMNISDFIPNGNYPVDNDITSNGFVLEGTTVNFKAGNSIELTNDFSAEYNFSAEIEDCEIYYGGYNSQTDQEITTE